MSPRWSSDLLDRAAVVSPLQQGLALAGAAEDIAGFAIPPDLPGMAPERFPALDLAVVLVGKPPAAIIAAIPLEPAARVVGMDPALGFPDRQRRAGPNAEIIE